MKKGLNKNEIEKIRIQVEKEFPYDHALQQVHIARKILAKEAELAGMSLGQYIMKISLERKKRKK